MERATDRIKRVLPTIGLALALLVLLGLLAAHRSSALSESTGHGASVPATLPIVAQAKRPNAAPTALKLLKVEPVKGYAGDSFTVTGNGLAPGQQVDFFWVTVDAAYVTKVLPDNVEYHERKYEEKRLRLGSAAVDAQGRVTVGFVVPDDFGEDHDLYAVVDGQDIARGGFRILRSATIAPTEGPVGTPITVTVKGLSWRGFEQFMALRYDNKYSGEISAVTTKGTRGFSDSSCWPSRQAHHPTQQQHRLRAGGLSEYPAIASGLYLRSPRQQTGVSFYIRRYQGCGSTA